MDNPLQGFAQEALEFDYDANQPREIFIAQVEAQGFRPVYPADDELQIDIDSEEDYARFKLAWECVQRNWAAFGEFSFFEKESKSGLPCRHITVKVPFKLDPWQRIALQAALGSDQIRELLSATRLIKGDIHPTMFVEPKE